MVAVLTPARRPPEKLKLREAGFGERRECGVDDALRRGLEVLRGRDDERFQFVLRLVFRAGRAGRNTNATSTPIPAATAPMVTE